MITFGEFLRQRQRKTSASKGVEQSSHDSLNPDLIRIDDTQLRLRWRAREGVGVIHQLENKIAVVIFQSAGEQLRARFPWRLGIFPLECIGSTLLEILGRETGGSL